MQQPLAVLRPGDQRIGVERLVQRQCLVVVDDAGILDRHIGAPHGAVLHRRIGTIAVEAFQPHPVRAVFHSRMPEQLRERHAGELAAAHRARIAHLGRQLVVGRRGAIGLHRCAPAQVRHVAARGLGHAAALVVEVAFVVAGAFGDGAHAASREIAQIVERELQGPLDFAAERERPIVRMHRLGHVELSYDVGAVGRGDQSFLIQDRRAPRDDAALGILARDELGSLAIRPAHDPVALDLALAHRYLTVTSVGTIQSQSLRWKFQGICGCTRPFSSVARPMIS